MLERAYTAGEAEGEQVALLADRLAVARGEPQAYGTQVDFVSGARGVRVVLRPIAHSARVDARRARLGLRPLVEQLRSTRDSLRTARPNPSSPNLPSPRP